MRLLLPLLAALISAGNVRVVESVELTQTACQFVEPERGGRYDTEASYELCRCLSCPLNPTPDYKLVVQ